MADSRREDDDVRQQESDFGASENTPLLAGGQTESTEQSRPQNDSSASSLLRGIQGSKGGRKKKLRWPSLIALLILCIVAALIIIFAFVAPTAVQQYAAEAIVFEPTSLSIDSFTATGVRARVQGNFKLDSTRVKQASVRRLGKLCTYIAEEVETGEGNMAVSLPEYGNVLLGIAHLPPIKAYIRDQHITGIDFLTDLEPGDVDGIRAIANDWIDGRLGSLRVVGRAQVPLKSGLISLGQQLVQQEMTFSGDEIPSIPAYDIKKLNFREVDIPTGKGMAADVSIKVQNDFPIDFTVPPLGFGILVDNCEKSDPYIMLADAITEQIHIQPKKNVVANATGTVRELPSVLTQDCPGTSMSPLDMFLGRYIHGKTATVYVRGSDSPSLDTPGWITDLMRDITVPVPVPGRTFGHLIKNFSLTDTHFSLPDPWAEPGTPASNPRISANVLATISLPEEMNFSIDVNKVRADADVFYKKKKLGRLDLSKWQDANSTRIDARDDEGPTLLVQSAVKDAPLEIQDEDVFTDVIQALMFGTKTVVMTIKAEVDVGVDTALGDFAIRKIPAEGSVPIKPVSRPQPPPDGHNPPKHGGQDLIGGLDPKITDLNIVNTTKTSLTIVAGANVTNPTNYTASIPYIDIHIIKNGSLLGHATARNLSITTGLNAGLSVEAVYAPLDISGPEARAVGRELISQYISGWNTTITLQMHEKSIPANPKLSRALSRFPIEVQAPKLGDVAPPDDGDDDGDNDPEEPPDDPWNPDGDDEDNGDSKKRKSPSGPHFIRDATMHLLSSSATFLLLSPLQHSTLVITDLNATAFYNDDPASNPDSFGDPVGNILYDIPIAIPPIKETPDGKGYLTPKLPVEWRLGSVGYGAVRKALGGELKLAARADVGVRLGRWREEMWYMGQGLGVKIRL
ncbi:hypothetical protein CB0940_04902 [Cercospora beticola]|uniref:Pre-rRNA processing protein n=1 Tax=Cercospora beticola TaxID=122368 RepID=A0A2G5HLQ7_CERBT|nr:hypothetical protein CB0940_04902 [Cercospora beticola]PIA93479.1 hypothetical protein CB0940_04902 [Cercospora beticola]WPB02186.1 hypothetical protein RHO25_006820 [Cercospora beticola]